MLACRNTGFVNWKKAQENRNTTIKAFKLRVFDEFDTDRTLWLHAIRVFAELDCLPLERTFMPSWICQNSAMLDFPDGVWWCYLILRRPFFLTCSEVLTDAMYRFRSFRANPLPTHTHNEAHPPFPSGSAVTTAVQTRRQRGNVSVPRVISKTGSFHEAKMGGWPLWMWYVLTVDRNRTKSYHSTRLWPSWESWCLPLTSNAR
jgi:hypothetical protein